jgi:hypothetical protein
MLEIYVIVTLGALGYLLNSMNTNVKETKLEVDKSDNPSMTNIYDSTYYATADNIEKNRAAKVFEKSKNPSKTNVISKNQYFDKDDKVKSLTGEYVSKDEFKHNNMIPFFGGHVRQNMDENANRTVLENFTGVGDLQKNKCEVASFYDRVQDNIYGSQNKNDYYKERIVAPTIRNNEFPIQQVHVGPGLNKGYTTEGSGGFQQFDVQDYGLPKTVDELRVLSKPKLTFEGRVLPGALRSGLPGKQSAFAKNRVETFYEQNPDMYLKTTASVLKQMEQPNFDVKQTHRINTTREYKGTAYINRSRQADPSVKPTDRQQLSSTGIRNAILSVLGLGDKYDYGKSNVVVYNNERDLTTTRTYQGNIQSIVKAIIAPFEDMIKITKKQETVDNPREYGSLAPQMPNKPQIHDPNDTARTTIKETTLNEADFLNLKGHEKIKVHDPNDTARTTIKETTLNEADFLNLKGHEKITIYDPNDTARTTIKETLLNEADNLNLTGPKELYVYDPDEIAKRTLRETLDRNDYELNYSSIHKKIRIHDPDDVAKTTMKETLIDGERYGNTDRFNKGGAYETNEYDAKNTQKQFLSDIDYYGVGTRDKGMGYNTNEYDAKNTQKQFLSDYEHFGHAEATTEKKMQSYDNYENARIRENKEVTMFRREPQGSGVKSFNCQVAMQVKKADCDTQAERLYNTNDRVYSDTPRLITEDRGITKNRMSVDLDIGDRLDIGLLDALKNNPYHQSIGVVAGY